MEILGGAIYILVFSILFALGQRWFQERSLRKLNQRLNEESIRENGRLEDREKMDVVRLRKD